MSNHPRRRRDHKPRRRGLTVWPNRKGDGDYAFAIAAARGPEQLTEAMQRSHDFVIQHTGALRAGPVHWRTFDRDSAPAELAKLNVTPEPELQAFLAQSPEAVVVVAMCATDAPHPQGLRLVTR